MAKIKVDKVPGKQLSSYDFTQDLMQIVVGTPANFDAEKLAREDAVNYLTQFKADKIISNSVVPLNQAQAGQTLGIITFDTESVPAAPAEEEAVVSMFGWTLKVTVEGCVVLIDPEEEKTVLFDGEEWLVPSVEFDEVLEMTALTAEAWSAGSFTVSVYKNLSDVDAEVQERVKISDVIDNLEDSSADKPLSANMGRALNVKIGQVAENGLNAGVFDTHADLTEAVPVPKPGAYAYIREDENHNGETWRYDQGLDTDGETLVWEALVRINEVPRNFEQEPVTAPEIAEGAVTPAKMQVPFTQTEKDYIANLANELAAAFLKLTGGTVKGDITFKFGSVNMLTLTQTGYVTWNEMNASIMPWNGGGILAVRMLKGSGKFFYNKYNNGNPEPSEELLIEADRGNTLEALYNQPNNTDFDTLIQTGKHRVAVTANQNANQPVVNASSNEYWTIDVTAAADGSCLQIAARFPDGDKIHIRSRDGNNAFTAWVEIGGGGSGASYTAKSATVNIAMSPNGRQSFAHNLNLTAEQIKTAIIKFEAEVLVANNGWSVGDKLSTWAFRNGSFDWINPVGVLDAENLYMDIPAPSDNNGFRVYNKTTGTSADVAKTSVQVRAIIVYFSSNVTQPQVITGVAVKELLSNAIIQAGDAANRPDFNNGARWTPALDINGDVLLDTGPNQNNANAFVATGLYNTLDTEIEIEMAAYPNQGTGAAGIFGNTEGNAGNAQNFINFPILSTSGNNVNLGTGYSRFGNVATGTISNVITTYNSSNPIQTNAYKLTKDAIYKDGVLIKALNATGIDAVVPASNMGLFLFSICDREYQPAAGFDYSRMTKHTRTYFKSCKIWQGGVLVRHYIAWGQ